MARNFDSAGRGGLGSLIEAYNAGEDRSRAIAKDKADSTREGQQFSFQHGKNYLEPETDAFGFVKGYKTNQDTRRRNTPVLNKLKPEYFRDQPPGAAAPAIASPASAAAHVADPAAATVAPQAQAAPNGQAPGDPKPLLKSPDAASQESAQQHEVQVQANAQQSQDASQNKDILADVDRTNKDMAARTAELNAQTKQKEAEAKARNVRYEGVDKQARPGVNFKYQGEPEPAAKAPPAAPQPTGSEFDPDDYMMGRITDMATTPSTRALEPMISGKALSGVLGRELPDVQLPASMWKSIIAGEYKDKGKAQTGIDPAHIPYIQAVEGGQKPGDVLEAYQEDHPGERIPKTLTDALYKGQGADLRMKGQSDANTRAATTNERIDRKEYEGMVGKASDAWGKVAKQVMEESAYARTAKTLVNQKDTRGVIGAVQNMMARASSEKGPLGEGDIRRFSGMEGWAERADQFINKASNEGLTADNVKFFNKLADVYIDAAEKKAEELSKPIIGGLRARAKSYGKDPDAAESLFRDQVDMGISLTGDAPGKQKPKAPAAPASHAPKGAGTSPEGTALSDKFQEALKEAEKIKDPVRKRKVKAAMYNRYKQMGGK